LRQLTRLISEGACHNESDNQRSEFHHPENVCEKASNPGAKRTAPVSRMQRVITVAIGGVDSKVRLASQRNNVLRQNSSSFHQVIK
jgi:hypothetical protein